MTAPSSPLHIVDYLPEHQRAFAALNYAWIERYFTIEAADRAVLDHPQEHILNPGGAILIGTCEGQVVATCALIPLPDQVVEIAKMAVSDAHQGKQFGWQLGQAAIARAREMGAHSVWLESNTILRPAIALYHKLGFREVPQQDSEYQRSNIQMTLDL